MTMCVYIMIMLLIIAIVSMSISLIVFVVMVMVMMFLSVDGYEHCIVIVVNALVTIFVLSLISICVRVSIGIRTAC